MGTCEDARAGILPTARRAQLPSALEAATLWWTEPAPGTNDLSDCRAG